MVYIKSKKKWIKVGEYYTRCKRFGPDPKTDLGRFLKSEFNPRNY